MIIIQIEGGLGNQMFQYALALSFIEKGIKVKLCFPKKEGQYVHNGYELENIFHVGAQYCTAAERNIIKRLSKFLHILTQHPYKEKKEWQWMYREEVSKSRFGFLKGYWQAGSYFSGIADVVKEKYSFPPLQDNRNQAVLDRIINSNSVSLHIRRGDYLNADTSCSVSIQYYRAAIAKMNSMVNDPYYFVFSDDIPWARQNIMEPNIEFIDWNTGKNSFIDMQLMSRCKHNIIANSSFSWWGAWLNNYPAKLVMAPQQWMPQLKSSADIIPANWIQIKNNF